MDLERQLAQGIFTKFIKSKYDKQIELHLFEYANNNKKHYIDKLKYIFQLINPKSSTYNKNLVQQIKKNIIKPNELIYSLPWDLCKEHWEKIIEEQNKTDKIVMDKTPQFTSTQFTCAKCKNNKCTTYSLQTRSADEPMTIFVTCIKCDNTWRMG